jgi:bacterioferritin
MYRNWGLEQLNERSYKKSIKDMRQADDLIERILFLEGLPNLQQLEKIRIGEHTVEMLQCDMDFQLEQLALLREAIEHCEQTRDYISRDILEDILAYEEEHVDWIEAQQYLIANSGLENYLQANM